MIFTRLNSFALFFALTFMIGIISGCATQQQVREIVTKSNASLMTAMLPDIPGLGAAMPLADSEKDADQKPWLAPSAKIDLFIEAHPDQKVTASALRVRQAMLLLAYKQYNLARAAFEMVEPQHLANARDKALYDLRVHLVWWFRVSKLDSISLQEFQKADSALEAFQAKVNTLAEPRDPRLPG